MSPRRRIQPDEKPLLIVRAPKLTLKPQWWRPSRRWALPLTMVVTAGLAAGAVTANSFVLVNHERQHELAIREVDVLGFVRSFMTGFTSLDPYHANDYVLHVLAQASGDFAKHFHEHQNEILLSVARAEPTKGLALEAGVERWNDDDSANVLAATEITAKSPDGKQVIENTNRWVITAQREGDQWKISSLQQMV